MEVVPLFFHWEQLPALPFSRGKCLHPVPSQRILFPLPTPPSSRIPEIWDPIHQQSRIPAFLPSRSCFAVRKILPGIPEPTFPAGSPSPSGFPGFGRILTPIPLDHPPDSWDLGFSSSLGELHSQPSRFPGFGIIQIPGIQEDPPPSPQSDHPLPAGFGISLWMQERDHPSLHRSQISTPHS